MEFMQGRVPRPGLRLGPIFPSCQRPVLSPTTTTTVALCIWGNRWGDQGPGAARVHHHHPLQVPRSPSSDWSLSARDRDQEIGLIGAWGLVAALALSFCPQVVSARHSQPVVLPSTRSAYYTFIYTDYLSRKSRCWGYNSKTRTGSYLYRWPHAFQGMFYPMDKIHQLSDTTLSPLWNTLQMNSLEELDMILYYCSLQQTLNKDVTYNVGCTWGWNKPGCPGPAVLAVIVLNYCYMDALWLLS